MSAELLLKEFRRISEAPDAIPRLRRFIVDLAVRGTLTERDSNDERAHELLRRIERQKGAGHHQRAEETDDPAIAREPSSLPRTWCWTSLGDLSTRIHYGYTASANPAIRTPRLLRITDIQNGRVDWNTVPGCDIREEETKQFMLKDGDILVARTGGTIGKTFLVKQPPVKAVFASYLIRIQPSPLLLADYLKLFMESGLYWSQLEEGSRGAGQPNVNGRTLAAIKVPLAPLSEQHRIVVSVSELMNLCDELGLAKTRREARRDKLVSANLARLTTAADENSFKESAGFYFNHLPRFTTRKEHIQHLNRAILDLGVRGCLVQQQVCGSNAPELLLRIAEERKRRTQAGLMKQPGPLQLVGDEREVDHALPGGWQFCFIDELAIKVTDGEHATPRRSTSGRYLLSARNVTDAGIDLSDVDFVPEDEYLRIRKRCDPDRGDVLISCSGSIGRVAVVDEDDKYVMVRSTALIKLHTASINPFYLAYALRSTSIQQQIIKYSRSTAQANLFLSAIRRIRVPLPPIAEQQAIVKKIDELRTVLDNLDIALTSRATVGRALLNAALRQVLACPNAFSEANAGA